MKIALNEVYVCVVLALAALFVLCLALMFYLAYCRIKEILGYLNNSPAVTGRSMRLSLDPLSRLALLGHISMMLIIPRRSIRKEILNAQDYERFPRGLKALIRFCNYSMWLLAALMVVMYVLYR